MLRTEIAGHEAAESRGQQRGEHFAIVRLLTSVSGGVANRMRIIIYHGTDRSSAERIQHDGFHPSKDGMLGPGVYCSRDPNKANHHGPGKHGANGVILRLIVSVGKVHAIRDTSKRNSSWQHQTNADNAWVIPGVQPSGEEDCVKNSSQVQVLGFATQSDPRGHVVRNTAEPAHLTSSIDELTEKAARAQREANIEAQIISQLSKSTEHTYSRGEFGVGGWPTRAQWQRFLQTAPWKEHRMIV